MLDIIFLYTCTLGSHSYWPRLALRRRGLGTRPVCLSFIHSFCVLLFVFENVYLYNRAL